MIVPAFEPAPADSDGGVKTNPSDVPVPDRIPLHLGVKGLEPRLLVSLVRFEAPPHDLHVLLRHRARSISRKYLLSMQSVLLRGKRAGHRRPGLETSGIGHTMSVAIRTSSAARADPDIGSAGGPPSTHRP